MMCRAFGLHCGLTGAAPDAGRRSRAARCPHSLRSFSAGERHWLGRSVGKGIVDQASKPEMFELIARHYERRWMEAHRLAQEHRNAESTRLVWFVGIGGY